MTEAFLQYIWKHKMLDGNLTTTDGVPLVVERPGEQNRDAGPDFFNARISIGEVRWAGNVEVHVRASDWKHHGHSADKAYNNIILHVVYVNDCDVVLEDGKRVPTLVVSHAVPLDAWENYEKLMQADADVIPCAPRLKEIPDFLFHVNMERMLVERMERKSHLVLRLLNESHGNWEQTCYWLTARYFGGKINAVPFELLAKRTPMNVAAKVKDNTFRVEALYMGQAGLLDDEFDDEFPRALQREYDYMQMAYKLSPLEKHLWKFFRLRPYSFPTIRVSQFANLIARSSNLFSKLLDATDIQIIRSLFEAKASDYWSTHFTFDTPAPEGKRTVGRSVTDMLVINVWVPLLFQYGVAHDEPQRKEQAFDLLRQLPAENNSILRLWRAAGIKVQNAADSQALLQCYNEYCHPKHCLDCQLAYKILRIDNSTSAY